MSIFRSKGTSFCRGRFRSGTEGKGSKVIEYHTWLFGKNPKESSLSIRIKYTSANVT